MPQIELLKIHTHAGVEHGAGAVIDVDGRTANWLIENGVGHAATVAETQRYRHTAVGQTATSAEPRRSRHNEATPVSPLTSHKE